MYCLKVSLCCIHWSPPSYFVKTGINGKRLGAGVRPGGQGIVERAPICSFLFCNNARDASRVSRKSRIFWRLQNISGPGTRRETRDSCRSHIHTYKKSKRHLHSKEDKRKEEGKKEQEECTERESGKEEKHQKLLSPWPRMLSDFFFCGDR